MHTCARLHGGPLRSTTARWLAVVLIALLSLACSSGPVPIAYGVDDCAYCRMRISDPRYGGELVTRTGKVLEFDSIECLAAYYSGLQDTTAVRSRWVADYRNPGKLIPAEGAVYIHRGGPGSPMGMGLLALASGSGANIPESAVQGDTLSWPEVVELVRRESLTPGSPPADAGPVSNSTADAHAR